MAGYIPNPDSGSSDGLRGELLRRGIHLSGLIIPLAYHFGSWGKGAIAYILGIIFLMFLLVDLLRLRFPALEGRFLHFFPGLIKQKEKKPFLGSTYFLLGAFLTVVLFDKKVAMATLLFLVLGDQAASFFGKKFGKRIIMGKTWEGTIACTLVCFAVSLTILPAVVALVGAMAASLSELFLSRYVDDNLAVPLVSGAVISLLNY